MGGVPEIEEKKFDLVLGLLFASRNPEIVKTPLRYLVFGSEKDMRSRFSTKVNSSEGMSDVKEK